MMFFRLMAFVFLVLYSLSGYSNLSSLISRIDARLEEGGDVAILVTNMDPYLLRTFYTPEEYRRVTDDHF